MAPTPPVPGQNWLWFCHSLDSQKRDGRRPHSQGRASDHLPVQLFAFSAPSNWQEIPEVYVLPICSHIEVLEEPHNPGMSSQKGAARTFEKPSSGLIYRCTIQPCLLSCGSGPPAAVTVPLAHLLLTARVPSKSNQARPCFRAPPLDRSPLPLDEV